MPLVPCAALGETRLLAEEIRGGTKVVRKAPERLFTLLAVLDADDCGWVKRRDNVVGQPSLGDRSAALARDSERAAEQSLRGGCPEHDEHTRPDRLELGVEPLTARVDLRAVGLVVDAALAARPST